MTELTIRKRKVCPKGHITLNKCRRNKRQKWNKDDPHYYCQTCNRRYEESEIHEKEIVGKFKGAMPKYIRVKR